MDLSIVDIEEVGFDRSCSKEVHGSLHRIDIHLFVSTGVAHTDWPKKGEITELQGKLTNAIKNNKHDLPSVVCTATDEKPREEGTLDLYLFHQWSKSGFGIYGLKEVDITEFHDLLRSIEEAGIPVEEDGAEFVWPTNHKFILENLSFKHLIATCAHVQRDMRCGYCGSVLHDLFVKEVEERKQQEEVKAVRVNHIGGHAYAGNVLVYPEGIWYGYFKPADVKTLFDDHLKNGNILHEKLRGKMGLSKDESIKLATKKV